MIEERVKGSSFGPLMMALCIWVLRGDGESQSEKSLTCIVEIVFALWRVLMIEEYGWMATTALVV